MMFKIEHLPLGSRAVRISHFKRSRCHLFPIGDTIVMPANESQLNPFEVVARATRGTVGRVCVLNRTDTPPAICHRCEERRDGKARRVGWFLNAVKDGNDVRYFCRTPSR